MLVKLDDTPGQYTFEVRVGDDGDVRHLEVNYPLANAAIRNARITEDDWSNQETQPDLVLRVAAAARSTMSPKEIVDAMTDAEVFARVNMAGFLDKKLEDQAGEVPEPSPT